MFRKRGKKRTKSEIDLLFEERKKKFIEKYKNYKISIFDRKLQKLLVDSSYLCCDSNEDLKKEYFRGDEDCKILPNGDYLVMYSFRYYFTIHDYHKKTYIPVNNILIKNESVIINEIYTLPKVRNSGPSGSLKNIYSNLSLKNFDIEFSKIKYFLFHVQGVAVIDFNLEIFPNLEFISIYETAIYNKERFNNYLKSKKHKLKSLVYFLKNDEQEIINSFD